MNRYIFIFVLFLQVFGVGFAKAQEKDSQIEYLRAIVVSVEDVGKGDESVAEREFDEIQSVKVRIEKGDRFGQEYIFEHNTSLFSKDDFKLRVNDRIIVTYQRVGDEEKVAMADFVRLDKIWVLLGIFVLLLLFIGRWIGLRSIVGFGWIAMVFVWFLIPQILSGSNVYWIVFFACLMIILGTSLVLSGFRRRTLLIILSSFFGLIVSTMLVLVVGNWSRFSQIGLDESHLFHVSQKLSDLDLIAIIYGGMIMGALGSMMDLSISIIAGVEEMMDVNREKGTRKLEKKELFDSGLKIGREIMAVNANTLLLAYAGSALTVWMVAISQGYSWSLMSNFNMIFGEILRILTGTIGIFASIPMTAWLASRFLIFSRKYSFEKNVESE